MKNYSVPYTIYVLVVLMLEISPVYCQTLEEIIAAQEIDTVLFSGSKDNRVNFAIQNRADGFSSKEDFYQLFRDDLFKSFTPGNALSKTPYAEYRDFFNLFAFWWPEALDDDSGWSFEILHGVRDYFFLPWANDTTGWITFFSTSRWGGGGGAGLSRDRRVGSGKMYGMGWETFLHEFGHTMPGQLDEYTSSGIWSGGQCWETPNTTSGTFIDDIPWRKWIEPETPIPTPYSEDYLEVIGAFEGAMTNFYGCHRPTARGCFMGAGGFEMGFGNGLCSPCRQRIVCYLYKYVNPIENAEPSQQQLTVNGNESIHFAVDVIHPVPNTQKYQWILNGKVIAEDVLEVNVEFGECDNYELKFTLLDTTNMVRYDEKYDAIYPRPYKEWVWSVDQEDVNGSDLTLILDTKNSDCTGIPNGSISAEISGGTPPYDLRYVRNNIEGLNGALEPGKWKVFAYDQSQCGISDTAMVLQEPFLDASIHTSLLNENWTIAIESDNYNLNDLTFLWNTGATSKEIETDQDGLYSVTITTATLCSQIREVELIGSSPNLEVSQTVFGSSILKPSGRIYLEASGGRPHYTVIWKDSPAADHTFPDPTQSIASGTTWDHLPEYAFDNSLATKWLHFTPNDGDPIPWIGFDFLEKVQIEYYVITSADDVPERDPKNWEFQGSNNGVEWTTLDSRSNQSFTTRFQERTFVPESFEAFSQYRLIISENHGDGATQIQELELVAVTQEFTTNDRRADEFSRSDLAPGAYSYHVFDQNSSVVSDTILIRLNGEIGDSTIKVNQKDHYSVQIENPADETQYFWFESLKGESILHRGTEFQPTRSGNFYVGAQQGNVALGAMTGFAVWMPETPILDSIDAETVGISDPLPETNYIWYDTPVGGDPLSIGSTFSPGENPGYYYVAARDITSRPNAMDPAELEGIKVRMDASDIDGDGLTDDPAPETSSLLEWYFPGGNRWSSGGYFAYEAKTQNGLGTANFATLWLQALDNPVQGFQTIVLAYKEHELSFPETAPFEALSYYLPKHKDSTQLLSDNTPPQTLEGRVYLNGNLVDPLSVLNPMKFGILSAVLSEPSNRDVYYTDTHWEGRIGELILWDRELNEQEIQGVSEFLRKKWMSTADLESARTPFYWDGISVPVEIVQNGNAGYKITSMPNPVGTTGFLSIEKPNPEEARLMIYNSDGLTVYSKKVYAREVRVNLNTIWSDLPSGLYHAVLLQNNSTRVAYKILKIE